MTVPITKNVYALLYSLDAQRKESAQTARMAELIAKQATAAAERDNQTLLTVLRAYRLDAGLPETDLARFDEGPDGPFIEFIEPPKTVTEPTPPKE